MPPRKRTASGVDPVGVQASEVDAGNGLSGIGFHDFANDYVRTFRSRGLKDGPDRRNRSESRQFGSPSKGHRARNAHGIVTAQSGEHAFFDNEEKCGGIGGNRCVRARDASGQDRSTPAGFP